MTRVLLHLGTHKTGTTAFQAACLARREALRAHGIWVPPSADGTIKGGEQIPVLEALLRREPGAAERTAAALSRWRREAGEAVLLLSAEALSMSPVDPVPERWWARRRDALGDVCRLFDGLQLEPLLVFRHPEGFARSLFQQWTRYGRGPFGGSADFPEHLAWLESGPLRYADHLAQLEATLGPTRVIAHAALEATPDPAALLFAAWGVSAPRMPLPRTHVSPPLAITLCKRALARRIGAWPPGHPGHAWAEATLGPLVAACRGHEQASVWASTDERDAFIHRWSEREAQVIARAPGLLDAPPPATGGWDVPGSLIDAVVAAWTASGLARAAPPHDAAP